MAPGIFFISVQIDLEEEMYQQAQRRKIIEKAKKLQFEVNFISLWYQQRPDLLLRSNTMPSL